MKEVGAVRRRSSRRGGRRKRVQWGRERERQSEGVKRERWKEREKGRKRRFVTECWRLEGRERKREKRVRRRECGEERRRDGAKERQREEQSWVQRGSVCAVFTGSPKSATIVLLLPPVHLPPFLLPCATVRARACGVHDPNFFWLCVLPVVFLLIIQSEARCLQVGQGLRQGVRGRSLLEGWCMLRFQFGAAGHLFGPLPALLWRPQPGRNRFTGANLARNETDSAASSNWDDAAAATCAPQPAAFGGNKFVFNLKTFHSSLAFCSLIYGAKRFLFKYHRNFPAASEISARVPLFFW